MAMGHYEGEGTPVLYNVDAGRKMSLATSVERERGGERGGERPGGTAGGRGCKDISMCRCPLKAPTRPSIGKWHGVGPSLGSPGLGGTAPLPMRTAVIT